MANDRLSKTYMKVIIVVALVVICALAVWQKEIPKGIDLAGGTQLVYRVRLEELSPEQQRYAVQETIDIVRRRLDPDGSKELVIRKQGKDCFYIQLPALGATDSSRVEDLIRRAGKLRFSLVSDDEDLRKQAREGSGPFDHAPYVPILRDEKTGQPTRWRKVSYPELAGLTEEEASGWLLIDHQPAKTVTGEYLVNPKSDTYLSKPVVAFSFRGKGGRVFHRLTSENLGRQLAIVLDKELYSAPVIEQAISGSGIIRGEFTQAEVDDLVATLRAGSLPADIELESSKTVGAELGEDSIRAGIRASITALILVLAFMALYYLLTGLIADFAVALNLLIVLAAMASMQMTLTLPGIAGLVLTLGMAVDANVLINERIREERERGKTLRLAIQSGYERAFVTILDSNLTTMIAAMVLFFIGTEAVRGFAKTLLIGIAVSMFTAIWVTRAIVDLLIELGWLKALRMLPVLARPHIPFSRIRHLTMAISGVLIVAGLLVFIQRGENKYDTDFAGGFGAEIALKRGMPVDECRKRVGDIFDKADVQSVWTAGEEAVGGDPTRFSIRIRPLGNELKNEKMRDDITAALERKNLLEKVDSEGDLWRFKLALSENVTEKTLRACLADVGYPESQVDEIFLKDLEEDLEKDLEASEYLVRLSAPKMDEKQPDADVARVLDGLGKLVASEEVRILHKGNLVVPERSAMDTDAESAVMPHIALHLDKACPLPAIREALIQQVLGGDRKRPENPDDFRVVGDAEDRGSELCSRIAVYAAEKTLEPIVQSDRQSIEVFSFSLPSAAEIRVSLNQPQSERTLRDRMNEKELLTLRKKDEDLEEGDDPLDRKLVRNLIPLEAEGQAAVVSMLPLSEDKAKEKIKDDLLDAFKEELAVTPVSATIEPMETPPEAGNLNELLSKGFRFFRLKLDTKLQRQEIRTALEQAGFAQALVVDGDMNTSEVATEQVDEAVLKLQGGDEAVAEAREKIVAAFASADPEDAFRSINTIGSRVSAKMKDDALLAVVVSCLLIIGYIWFRFGEVKFGLAAVAALVHDVLMTAGAVGVADALSGTAIGNFLGFSDIKVNVTMIAAFLTLIGYSINDTIVVFDRIRENMGGVRRRVDGGLVDASVNQILSRTLLTSLTTLMALVVLYVVGGPVIHGFAFVLTFGVLVGTYSSVFIASPILIGWESFMAGLRKTFRIVTFRFGD